jgi:hypothetical protein
MESILVLIVKYLEADLMILTLIPIFSTKGNLPVLDMILLTLFNQAEIMMILQVSTHLVNPLEVVVGGHLINSDLFDD